jgi:hypothetical protein
MLNNLKIKRFNLSLYQDLIHSDFCLVKTELESKKQLLKSSLLTDVSTAQSFQYFDLVEMVKQLKTLIRLLAFLQRSGHSELILSFTNLQHYLLSLDLLNDLIVSKQVSVQYSEKRVAYELNPRMLFFCFVGSQKELPAKKIQRLLFQKICLIMQINSKKCINSQGSYRFLNEITDIKKLMFLILVIKNCYKK